MINFATDLFTARRAERLNDFDGEIRPIVERSLEGYGSSGWEDDIVEGASVLWLEIFEREEGETPGPSLATYQRELHESLRKTSQPSEPPTEGEIERVVRWVGVYTVNSATYRAGVEGATKGRFKTWVTMHDDDVRSMHSAVDGQTVPLRGTFSVGGEKMLFPGEPVGSPEHWINCRCLLQITEESGMSGKTSFAVDVDVDDPDTEVEDGDIEEEDLVDDTTEVPWHGVLTIEGAPTGDKRMFEVGSLSYRDLPLPLTWQRSTAPGHDNAVVVGTIDEIWPVEIEGGIVEQRARGRLNLNVPEANEVVDGIIFGMLGGTSVDIDDAEFELDFKEPEEGEEDDLMGMLFGGDLEMTRFTKGRISGAAMVNIPAFQEGKIALGAEFEDELRDPDSGEEDEEIVETIEVDDPELKAALEALFASFDEDMEDVSEAYSLVASAFAPGTKDGPGWLTNPKATARIRRYWTHGKGAAKIRWGQPGDFNRCRSQLGKYVNPAFLAGTCANMHKEAIGVWPGRERGDKGKHASAPAMQLLASGSYEADLAVMPYEFYTKPDFERPVGITIDKESGRVFGYLGIFGQCHIGFENICVMPPRSASKYSKYLLGVTDTDQGEVYTGVMTMATGHAGKKLTYAQATAFYDNTGNGVADIVVGEDEVGIWYSGALREGVTPAEIKTLKASQVSGDWRDDGRGNLELVGVLAVNTGGFTAPPRVGFAVENGRQLSLVAAGALAPQKEQEEMATRIGKVEVDVTMGTSAQAFANIVADTIEDRETRRQRLALARDPELVEEASQIKARRLAAARSLEV
jgi:hypothetical protein